MELSDRVVDDAFDILQGDSLIPGAVREHHDVGAFRAQILATRFAHTHHSGKATGFDPFFERSGNRFALTVGAADFVRFPTVDADK